MDDEGCDSGCWRASPRPPAGIGRRGTGRRANGGLGAMDCACDDAVEMGGGMELAEAKGVVVCR